MKKTSIIILMLPILFLSCDSNISYKREIKKEYYDAIKDYVMDKEGYNQFLLIPANKFYTLRDDIHGYLIGPLYPILLDIFETNVYKLVSFSSNKTVYFTTDFKELFEDEYYNYEIIKDSVLDYSLNGEDHYDRNPLVNFLKRSRLLYLKENMIINHQPDTLFLPKTIIDDKNEFINTDFTEIPDL